MYNILFLGGAKRVSMARFFKKAAQELGLTCQIYSYELDKHVPVSIEAKILVGRKWKDPYVIDDLVDVIKRYDIGLVVPFVDGAVEIAAKLAQSQQIKVFAPTYSPEKCRAMFDKVEAAKIFESLSLPIPKTYKGGAIDMPLIAKPRFGSASKGIVLLEKPEDLQQLVNIEDYLVQEQIINAEEYTVDCYVSVTNGEPLAIVPRQRIEVSGGEVVRTETVISPEIYDLAKTTLSQLGLRGAVTIQVLRDPKDGRCLLMEINPRLGGGAVCSVLAHADLPLLILSEAIGKHCEPVCYRPYTEITRYPQEIVFFN